jgi:archaemetzincin
MAGKLALPLAALVFAAPLLLALARAGDDPAPRPGTAEPLLDDEGFERLAPPRPGEWRAAFPDEEPQFVSDYERDLANRASPARRTIYVLPLGRIAATHGPLLETTRAYCAAFFGCEAKLLPPIDLPKAAYVAARRQYDGDRLLRFLEPRVPGDAIAVAGFLAEDIFSEDLNFVFGVATLAKRVGVYSIARLDEKYDGMPQGATLERRTIAVASHEIGHIFGIEHCLHYRCVMNGSNSLEESDGQPLHLCPIDLEKLRRNVGFDPAARYEALERFYEKHGYASEAAFCRARRAHKA